MVGGTSGSALSENQIVRASRAASTVFTIFLRILSLLLIGSAVFFWTQVLGFGGPDLEIRLNDNPFRAYILTGLCVFVPTTAVGLWLGMSWGIILWAIVGIGLVIAHFFVQPLSLFVYSFAAALTVLLVFYLFAVSLKYWIDNQSKEK